MGILCTEAIVSFKYREGTGNLLYNPTPLYISIPWLLFFGWTFGFWTYLRFKPGHTVKYIEKKDEKKEKRVSTRSSTKKL